MAQNGGNDDQIQNCILEVCCGEDKRQARALGYLILREVGSDPKPIDVAEWITDHYDLAPKGSLYAFKQEIARLARGPAYKEE